MLIEVDEWSNNIGHFLKIIFSRINIIHLFELFPLALMEYQPVAMSLFWGTYWEGSGTFPDTWSATKGL